MPWPPPGKRWLPRNIAALLYDGGWRDENLITMVCIVLQESEGYEEAVGGPNPNGTFDWGLFQLNEDGAETWGFDKDSAFDPAAAMSVARAMFLKRGFQPWAAFNSGRYKADTYRKRALEGVYNMWRVKYGFLAP